MIEDKPKNGIVMDSILLTAVKIITMGASIIITMLLSKKFSLTDYGTYSQAVLITSIGSSISILGLTDAVNYFYNSNENSEQKQNYLSTIFAVQLIAGLLCAFVILVLQNQVISYFNNSDLIYIYIYIAFTPLLSNLQAMQQILFLNLGKAKIIALRNLIVSIMKFAFVLIACFLTESIVIIFILLLATDIMQVIYFAYYLRKYSIIIKLKETKLSFIPIILRFSIPMAAYILTSALSRDIDKIVIGRLADTETFAIYTNCSKILPFDFLTVSVATVLIPYITRFVALDEYEKGQQLFATYLQFAFLTIWIVAFGTIVTAPEMISFLYGEKYQTGFLIFIAYIIVSMIRFANVSIILSVKGKTRILMIYSVTALIINLIFDVLLFNLLGSIGPAIATVITTLIVNGLLLLQGASILHTSIGKLLNIEEMKVLIGEIMIMGSIAMIIRLFLNTYNIPSTAVLIITYSIYIAGMGIFNIKKIKKMLNEINAIKI